MISSTTSIGGDRRFIKSLEDVTSYLKRMTEDKALEEHLRSKLLKNWQSFPLPHNDIITALAKLQDGFLAGLHSGKVMFVIPPSVCMWQIHQGPVLGLFVASSHFFVIAGTRCIKIWNALTENESRSIQCAVPVTCVTGNIVKEIFFIGLVNGVIEQYHIKDTQHCDAEVKFTLMTENEGTGVSDMKTNDHTTWMAARYVSNALILWDHVNGVLLYHFEFVSGTVLPNEWVQGEKTYLPKHLQPNAGWEVFPDLLVFSSPLIMRMSGSHVSKIYSTKRPVEPDDYRWQAYSENLRKGHISSWCEHTLVTITKPGATKKTLSEKVVNEVEIDLGLDFTLSERSEANNYLAFACPNSLEVICLSAIEMTFVHRIAGPAKRTKNHWYLYTRFHKLLNQQGDTLVTMGPHERVTLVSPDCRWAACTSEKHDSKVSTTFSIKPLQRTEVSIDSPEVWPKDRLEESQVSTLFTNQSLQGYPTSFQLPQRWAKEHMIRKAFSKDSNFIALLFTKGLVIYRLEDQTLLYTLEGKFRKEDCKIKYDHTGRLVLTDETRLLILYPDFETKIEIPWIYNRISFLNREASEAIVYNLFNTCHCLIDHGDLMSLAEMEEGFEIVETLNNHQHCVGLNDSGIYLFLAKDLTMLVHFKPGHQVTISKSFPLMFTFHSDVHSNMYGIIEIWDLKLGLNVQSFASGLRHVLGHKLSVKGPATSDEHMKSINKLIDSRAPIKNSWIANFEQFVTCLDNRTSLVKPVALGVYEEHFERQCIVWRKLATLVSVGELSHELTHILIKPFNLNVLHLLANKSQAQLIGEAMEAGATVIKSAFGSPATLCIKHKSRKSLDRILFELIKLKEISISKFTSAVFHMNDDFLGMLAFGSTYLAKFLRLVVIPLPEDVLATTVIKPLYSLPDVKFSDNLWIDSKMYEDRRANEEEKLTVEYLFSPFIVAMELGSKESLTVLKVLTKKVNDMDVFTAPFIEQIINQKWNKLWHVILVQSLLYWGLLVAIIFRIFNYGDGYSIAQSVIFGLNTWFLVIEVIKVCITPIEYFLDLWHYVDLSRTTLTYTWVHSNFNPDLAFVVLLLSMMRGITSFEAFDHTRFYVRMIYDVVKGALSFILIFFYSTFAWGMLFELACYQNANNPMNAATTEVTVWNAWTTAMELNMGQFNVDGYGVLYWLVFMFASCLNCFIMLNLVVAVLADGFEKFQTIADAADMMQKVKLVYEYELMMPWKRHSGVKRWLQICQEEGDTDGDWSGKMEEMKKQFDEMKQEIMTGVKAEMKKWFKKVKNDSPEEDRKFAHLNEAIHHLKSAIGRLAGTKTGR